jgi:two-component system, NarL family, invasion response regulator UvrY
MIQVLIVDDHPIVRVGLQKMLSLTEDIEVTGEANNAYEALDLILHNRYDLIILDISMPGRSGIDIIIDIKRINPSVKILILTMHSESILAIRAFKLGVSGYISKESASDQLVSAIRLIMSGQKYASPEFIETLASVMIDDSDKQPHELLSNREFEVLCSIAKGKTIEEISELLYLSQSTIHSYRRRILQKMNLENNADLILYAINNKLI